MDDDDDDEGGFGGMYENGHWKWDDIGSCLVFVSDLPTKPMEAVQIITKAPTGAIEFRDDVDLLEQLRFRRRYQRRPKAGKPDVVTLQDVKDIAIYTAPVNILSPMLINLLHLPSTERFLRALILYSAYYLQVADEMSARILELETKVRTPECEILELEFRDNLSDLRVMVAKEYCLLLVGGGDTQRFHHMGPLKKQQSLSDKDARLIETLLRMSIQMVWLALGRKSFHKIELEINRLFKSESFNNVEHHLKTGYISKMAPEERAVLFGRCVRHDKKLTTRSPLLNEVFCHRPIDYRLLGLGVVQCPRMTNRLQYMWQAVVGQEETLKDDNVVLGIIGMPRSRFDTMLRPITQPTTDKSKLQQKTASKMTYSSIASTGSMRKTTKSTISTQRLYPDIVLPRRATKEEYIPPSFPDESEPIRHVCNTQRRRWLNRLMKLLLSAKSRAEKLKF